MVSPNDGEEVEEEEVEDWEEEQKLYLEEEKSYIRSRLGSRFTSEEVILMEEGFMSLPKWLEEELMWRKAKESA